MEYEKKHSDLDEAALVLKQLQSGGNLSDTDFQKKLQSVLIKTSATSSSPEQDLKRKCLLTLRALPKQEIGMNDTRVRKFLEKNNLRYCEYFVLNTKDVPQEIRRIMSPDSRNIGTYISALDIVILLADRMREAGDSIVNSESSLVHELAHSSATTENGFGVPGDISREKVLGGAFFEEGFADLLQRQYFSEHGNLENTWASTSRAKLTMNSVFPVSQTAFSDGQRIYIDAKRTVFASDSIHAGFGLELLCSAIPSLKKQLIKGRRNPKAFPWLIKKSYGFALQQWTIRSWK